MPKIESLQEQYENLDNRFEAQPDGEIDSGNLLVFDYEYPDNQSDIVIITQEFTAVCPWTNLPDMGTLTISYVPNQLCIELKSLKYYLLSYARISIVQEHVASRILKDLTEVCQPRKMTINLDYNVRGGLHTTVAVSHLNPEP